MGIENILREIATRKWAKEPCPDVEIFPLTFLNLCQVFPLFNVEVGLGERAMYSLASRKISQSPIR